MGFAGVIGSVLSAGEMLDALCEHIEAGCKKPCGLFGVVQPEVHPVPWIVHDESTLSPHTIKSAVIPIVLPKELDNRYRVSGEYTRQFVSEMGYQAVCSEILDGGYRHSSVKMTIGKVPPRGNILFKERDTISDAQFTGHIPENVQRRPREVETGDIESMFCEVKANPSLPAADIEDTTIAIVVRQRLYRMEKCYDCGWHIAGVIEPDAVKCVILTYPSGPSVIFLAHTHPPCGTTRMAIAFYTLWRSIRDRNSARVSGSLWKLPSTEDVVMIEFCF